MPSKTYETHKPSMSLTLQVPGIAAGTLKEKTLYFTQGLLVVEDEVTQKAIEELSSFKEEVIFLRSATWAKDQQVAKAHTLRAAANAASDQADAAEIEAGLKQAPKAKEKAAA